MTDYAIEASRAVEPTFYWAPHPEQMQPHPFQYAGVEYQMALKNGVYGDQPGLGKTAECILLGNSIQAKKTLVVCPASLRLNWEREIWSWSTIRNVSTHPIMKSSDGVNHDMNYVIVSYSLLANKNILAAILEKNWDHVILDEAHAIKDPKGNTRTKAIYKLEPKIGRLTMATGTPMPNQPIEAYNLIRLCNWEAINKCSVQEFRQFYYDLGGGMIMGRVYDEEQDCYVNKLHWSDEVRNVPRRMDDLQDRLRKYIMVRRLKSDVLTQLPPVQWHPFPLAMTKDIKHAINHPGWEQAEKLYKMDPNTFEHGVPIDGAIATARRELGEAKAPQVADYIEAKLQEIDKIVVSAWHRSVLDHLKDRLAKYGVAYMDGRTSAKRKQSEVDLFQNDADCRIILGQMQPLGEGWTLTAAQDVVIAEPDWVPGKNEQMVDRINRMGQTGSYTLAHVPVIPGTLDERILGTAIVKDRNIFQALDAR